jgi:hypothetical protein
LDDNFPLDGEGADHSPDEDEAYDIQEIDKEIELTEQGHITSGTREAYEKYQRRMYVWWASKTSVRMKRVGKAVTGFETLEDITVKDFGRFVYWECKKVGPDGRVVLHPETRKPMLNAYESIGNFRKALFNIFTEAKQRPSVEFVDGIKLFFKGLKRKEAQEKQFGFRRTTEGKAAMPFCVYAALQEEFFKQGKFFELAYTSFTWNLMCRTDNTAHITLKHLSTVGDSLCVEFSVSEMDKGGEMLHQFRRCFANPKHWQLDIMFCLACYLTTVPELGRSDRENVMLFPDTLDSQKKRYNESLSETLKTPHMLSFLISHGLQPSDFGAHSPELLQEAMAKLRRDIGGDVAEMLGAKAAESPKAAESVSEEGFHLYWWSKGRDKSRKGRIVPQCFTMPACTVYDAWRMWFMPRSDPSITPHMLPMLRICDHFHLPFKQQPRWCEWHAFMKGLMTGLQGELRDKIIRLDRRSVLTLAEVETSWGMVKHVADTYRCDTAGVEKANYARIQISTVLKNRARKRAAKKKARDE